MGHPKLLTCPACAETFEKSEALWTVCLDCGAIFPPGEDWAPHGPGRRWGEGTDVDFARVWPCSTGVFVYTAEDAAEKQREVRAD